MPITTHAYSDKVVLGGQNIGIEVNSKGILVVGFYKVNDSYIGRDAGFKIGDSIVKVSDQEVNSINEMVDSINKNIKNSKVDMTISRDNKLKTVTLDLVRDNNDVYKTGLYVKDGITGIGTLTYIDPKTKIYGALGHEIIESNTNQKIEVKTGKIFLSEITGATKSENNVTGEKNAIFNKNIVYGDIKENTTNGIFGTYTSNINQNNLIEVADETEITTGEAKIYTVLKDDEIKEYTINILKINPDTKTKNILFEITDDELMQSTNGVIKGMSGSPIVQNHKLIGAVTHAIVNDNEKGYGIFITTMLEEGEN
jgi:stage IV sporulation protein B